MDAVVPDKNLLLKRISLSYAMDSSMCGETESLMESDSAPAFKRCGDRLVRLWKAAAAARSLTSSASLQKLGVAMAYIKSDAHRSEPFEVAVVSVEADTGVRPT